MYWGRRNSLEGVGAARGGLLAGGAPPDASHLALGGVLSAEGARVLGVLGDLQVRDEYVADRVEGLRGNSSKRRP